jgi:hypothetical protein
MQRFKEEMEKAVPLCRDGHLIINSSRQALKERKIKVKRFLIFFKFQIKLNLHV